MRARTESLVPNDVLGTQLVLHGNCVWDENAVWSPVCIISLDNTIHGPRVSVDFWFWLVTIACVHYIDKL